MKSNEKVSPPQGGSDLMPELLSIDLTGAAVLADRMHRSGSRVAEAAAAARRLTAEAGGNPAAAERLTHLGLWCTTEAARLRALVAEVRALDDPGALVVSASPWHPSWAHPTEARHAAREALAALATTLEWGLRDPAWHRVVDLLERYGHDPVFALSFWAAAGSSATGYGGVLQTIATPLGDERARMGPLLHGLGEVLATATRAAPTALTYRRVRQELLLGVGLRPSLLEGFPLLLMGSSVFPVAFLRGAWTDLVLRPDRGQQVHGTPAVRVVEGPDGLVDGRALVLDAVARNPRAALAFVVGHDLHGTPNLDRLLGPGVLDGDDGRALAGVLRAATLPAAASVPAWAHLHPVQRRAGALATVDAVGRRAPLVGWDQRPTFARALADVAAANLAAFQLVPGSMAAAMPATSIGAPFAISRTVGLGYLALASTDAAARQRLAAAGRRFITESLPAVMGPAHVDRRRGLGLLWGSITDAAVAGRLAVAIGADADRARDRAMWAVAQMGVITALQLTPARAGAPVVEQAGGPAREALLPVLQLEAEERAASASLLGRREAWLSTFPIDLAERDALLSGFTSAVGPQHEPPGYRPPGPSAAEQVERMLALVTRSAGAVGDTRRAD